MSIRIKDLTTTASSPASDDFIALDGATNGTRKIPASDIGGGGTSDDITNESNVSGATVTGALNSLSDQLANEATARQSAVSSEASTRASADESLRSAIDALVSPQGQSVVVDSSLSISGAAADANATGDAVSDLKSALEQAISIDNNVFASSDWELGSFTSSGDSSSTTRLRTKYINISEFEQITLWVDKLLKFYCLFYDAQKTPITTIANTNGWKANTVYPVWTPTDWGNAKYFRLMIQRTDNTIQTTDYEYVNCTFNNALINNSETVNKLNLNVVDGIEYLNGEFWQGALSNGVFNSNGKYRVATPNIMQYQRDLLLTIATGYKVGVHTFANGTFVSDSGWRTGKYSIPANTQFKVVIAKTTEDTSSSADVDTFVHAVTINPRMDWKEVNSLNDRVSVVENLFRSHRYFSHLGIDKTSNIIIPNQSVADITRSRRLGFKVMELNVQKTSDSNYVVLHGSGGKFGTQFIGADSSDISDVMVSSKTLDWIKQNVRFVSKYDKYKTAPFTLQEMLTECKAQDIIPLVQYVDASMVTICDSIMGAGNYILNVYSGDRNGLTSAPCMSWTTYIDADEAVEYCNKSGKAFILGLDVSNSVYSSFTDDDWKTFFAKVHKEGYQISSAYLSASNVVKFFELGLDAYASLKQINEIESGNICNLFGDTEYSDFATTGTVSNQSITLAQGETITPNQQISPVFLGGGSLHIKFSGTLSVSLGGISTTVTSDGHSDMWFSSFVEESAPTFTVTGAIGGATVYEISYKASKM